MKTAITRLESLLSEIPALLKNIPSSEFEQKPGPGKWSKKEILGHLLDSATNNHQRFVRSQFEDQPKIGYAQDQWVRVQNYDAEPANLVILFWETYNRHLVWVIRNIPEKNYSMTCQSGQPQPATLQWLVNDYVDHVEYHLSQIVGEVPGVINLENNIYRK